MAYASYDPGNRELSDPTFEEALHFIRSDKTNEKIYNRIEYTCTNFANDFRSSALKVGYRCGRVLIFGANWNHALNCFNTTDHGLIFVEPQSDELIVLIIGHPYWNRTRYASPPHNTYADVVTSFLIDW